MSSTNSYGLRLTKLRKKYLAEYIRLTNYKSTGSDWDYKLWEFMHERDNNIEQHDVKRWIAAHKYMLVPDDVEIHDEGPTNNAAMIEHTTGQLGQAQANHDYEQHRGRTLPTNSAVSTSTATGLRILNTFQLAPSPAPSPRDLASTSGSSSSSFTTEDNASYFPPVAGSTANDEDLDLQCRDMQAIKNIYQSAFDAIEVIHDACMKLPEVKTCLIPLEEISKRFHRNHHKFIFPVRYQAARNSNGRVKVEAFANNDVYHHGMQDADEEMQDLEASPTYAGAENADIENETSSAAQTDERTGASYSRLETVDEDQNEPVYCFCSGVAYGQMIACDNPRCKIEWFHPGCVNLSNIPRGDWFCPQCR